MEPVVDVAVVVDVSGGLVDIVVGMVVTSPQGSPSVVAAAAGIVVNLACV